VISSNMAKRGAMVSAAGMWRSNGAQYLLAGRRFVTLRRRMAPALHLQRRRRLGKRGGNAAAVFSRLRCAVMRAAAPRRVTAWRTGSGGQWRRNGTAWLVLAHISLVAHGAHIGWRWRGEGVNYRAGAAASRFVLRGCGAWFGVAAAARNRRQAKDGGERRGDNRKSARRGNQRQNAARGDRSA